MSAKIEHDVEFFIDWYNRRNPICDGGKCNAIGKCVMNPWGEGGMQNPMPKRAEIMEGLAEITVKANQKIAELFKTENDDELPLESPTFELKMLECLSAKYVDSFR